MSGKSDFSDILAQWENIHDDSAEISRKAVSDERSTEARRMTLAQARRMRVQDELDLHQVTVEAAVRMTLEFLESSRKKGLRKVRVITGKGLHSPQGLAKVRPAVQDVIRSSRHVSEADFNPPASDGGSGAVIVLLKE